MWYLYQKLLDMYLQLLMLLILMYHQLLIDYLFQCYIRFFVLTVYMVSQLKYQ
jgi:hypothetical protein